MFRSWPKRCRHARPARITNRNYLRLTSLEQETLIKDVPCTINMYSIFQLRNRNLFRKVTFHVLVPSRYCSVPLHVLPSGGTPRVSLRVLDCVEVEVTSSIDTISMALEVIHHSTRNCTFDLKQVKVLWLHICYVYTCTHSICISSSDITSFWKSAQMIWCFEASEGWATPSCMLCPDTETRKTLNKVGITSWACFTVFARVQIHVVMWLFLNGTEPLYLLIQYVQILLQGAFPYQQLLQAPAMFKICSKQPPGYCCVTWPTRKRTTPWTPNIHVKFVSFIGMSVFSHCILHRITTSIKTSRMKTAWQHHWILSKPLWCLALEAHKDVVVYQGFDAEAIKCNWSSNWELDHIPHHFKCMRGGSTILLRLVCSHWPVTYYTLCRITIPPKMFMFMCAQ